MSDESETQETPQEDPPPAPPRREQEPVVYLYGAAADRRNKTSRRSRTGRVPRQVRLGRDKKTVVRRNRRVPVRMSWVEENKEELRKAIADGLIWVENAAQGRAPESWLKEMGLWTDPDETTRNYPTSSQAALNDAAAAEKDADEDDGDDDDDESDESEGSDDSDDSSGSSEESDEGLAEGTEGAEGTGDDPATPEAPETPESTPETPEADTTVDAPEGDTSEDITSEHPTAGEPLPEGWEEFVKRDLLTLMEDREIPVPDDQRNDTLISTISEWAAARGLE